MTLDPQRADAFGRLRRLIGDSQPAAGLVPTHLHLGEQRLFVPTELLRTLETGDAWSHYPPLGGTAELRAAYEDWLERRFEVASLVRDERIAFEPIPGSKQGVATAIQIAVARKRREHGGTPVVVIPDLCYPTYRAAADAAAVQVVTYDPEGEGFWEAIAGALARSSAQAAAIVVCNPGNPTGSVIDSAGLHALADLACDHGSTLIVDECYVDLWLTRPVGSALQLAAERSLPCPLIVLHTLSKRSGAPGLRSGFIAGDPESVGAYAWFNRTCGVSLARPVCAVSAALWRDDGHVHRLRAALHETWRITDAVLGDLPGYRRAEAGFFLWLPVDDGEAAARVLWQEGAVLAMPGIYLADNGEHLHDDEGRRTALRRLRLALVHPPSILAPALARLRAIVGARITPPIERDPWTPPCRSAS
jgi:N-succinyldiaminopimelate aminotransferase